MTLCGPHSYPQPGRPGRPSAASAWPVNVTMRNRSGIDAAASEEEPGCGRARGRCQPGRNGPGVPSATPPGGGSGGGSGRGPGSGSGSGSGLGSGRGRGRGSGAAQAERAPAVVRVPAGAPAAAGVPAAPAMVGAAATAAAPGAAAAALAAVAVAGLAAAPPVRGAPVPAMPASAGWDRRVFRPRALRERGRDLLPPWDSSPPGASYPRSGRVRAGGVHAGEGVPFCARRQRGRRRRDARHRPGEPPGWWPRIDPDEHVELTVSGGCCTSKRDAARSRNGKRGLRVPGTALLVAPRSAWGRGGGRGVPGPSPLGSRAAARYVTSGRGL